MSLDQNTLAENYEKAKNDITNLEKFTVEFCRSTLSSIDLQISTKKFVPTSDFFNRMVKIACDTTGGLNTQIHDFYKVFTTMIEMYGFVCPKFTKLIMYHSDCNFAKSIFTLYGKKNIDISISQLFGLKTEQDVYVSFIKEFDVNICLKFVSVDERDIDFVFRHNLIHGMKHAINNKFPIDDTHLLHCIKNKNKEIFDVLKSFCPLNAKHLELACEIFDVQIIGEILNQKIKPTKKCFDAVLNMSNGENGKNLIETIIEAGYDLTKENLISLVEKDVWIDDGFVRDEFFKDKKIKVALEDLCNKKNTFRYGAKPSITGLMQLIQKREKLSVIRDYVKKYGIEPNLKCFEIAACHRGYSAVIKFIQNRCLSGDAA